MNFFGANKKSGIKPAPPKIRVERVPGERKPTPIPSKLAAEKQSLVQRSKHSPARSSPSSSRSSPATPPSDRRESGSLMPGRVVSGGRKRKPSRQKSPTTYQHLESDSEDDGSATDFDDSYKRPKLDNRPVDLKRKLRSRKAFSDQDGGVFKMIHAADLKTEEKKPKLAAGMTAENVTVELQYPSASQRERYDLVFGKEKIHPTEEILEIAGHVTDIYLTKEQAKPFKEPNAGIIRQLTKARNLLSKNQLDKELLNGFKYAVDVYNSAIDKLIKDGALAANLDSIHHLPFLMVRCILRQVYDRAVSPKVDLLKQYENGTDNVYGELLHPFVSRILGDAGLKSDQVFVDLGSGVGNVVLQAALEFGCESWGCEMMENACKLADAQKDEFAARCRLWGIETGEVHLEKGDFLENQPILAAMKKADVILVNNQAFTPALNQRLTDLFLDLKNGCKIISLKSFVPHGHQISSRNLDNPVNLLDVVPGEYHSNSVSWTDAGGSYFMATKDESRLKAYEERNSADVYTP